MPENKFLFLRYKKEDFVLSDGISLDSVEVGIPPKKISSNECSIKIFFLQQVWMERKPNKKNLLLTHWENATLPHKVGS